MKLFFIKILTFLTFCISLFLVGLLRNKDLIESNSDKRLEDYVHLFKNHYKNRKSVNLVLGSSITRDLIIPEDLGKNWFSFTNSAQNIYESYIFLSYFKDLVQVDTVIIGIQPFDFPFSVSKIEQ